MRETLSRRGGLFTIDLQTNWNCDTIRLWSGGSTSNGDVGRGAGGASETAVGSASHTPVDDESDNGPVDGSDDSCIYK